MALKEYRELLEKTSISNILSYIPELSNSEKTKILKELLKKYEPSIINRALNVYQKKYIERDVVMVYTVKNTLKNLCGRETG